MDSSQLFCGYVWFCAAAVHCNICSVCYWGRPYVIIDGQSWAVVIIQSLFYPHGKKSNPITYIHTHTYTVRVCVWERVRERRRRREGERWGRLISAAAHFLEIFHMNIGSSCAAEDKRKWTVAAGAKDNTQCEKVSLELLLAAQRETISI